MVGGEHETWIEVVTSRRDLLKISLDKTEHPESAHLVPKDEQGRLRAEGMHVW